MVRHNNWLVFITMDAISWLISEYRNIMLHSTRTNQLAGLFRAHPNFRVKKMETVLPPAKSLFDGYSCPFVGFVICLLFGSCWVKVRGHKVWFAGIYPLSPSSKPFSIELGSLSNLWPMWELSKIKLSCVLPGHLATMFVNVPKVIKISCDQPFHVFLKIITIIIPKV